MIPKNRDCFPNKGLKGFIQANQYEALDHMTYMYTVHFAGMVICAIANVATRLGRLLLVKLFSLNYIFRMLLNNDYGKD